MGDISRIDQSRDSWHHAEEEEQVKIIDHVRYEFANWTRRRHQRLELRRWINGTLKPHVRVMLDLGLPLFREKFPNLEDNEILHEIELAYFKKHA